MASQFQVGWRFHNHVRGHLNAPRSAFALVLGIWNFFGFWILGFGDSAALHPGPPGSGAR